MEKDLAIQVEYDMDEQGSVGVVLSCRSRSLIGSWHTDQEWLDAVNIERKKDQINLVTHETFEIIMDRLEKEYFDLVRLCLSYSRHIVTSLSPNPDQEHPQVRLRHAFRGFNVCYMR